MHILEHYDAISRNICSVIDVAEFVRSAHSDAAYRQAAEEAYSIVSRLINSLNMNSDLYHKLLATIEKYDKDFNEEDKIFAHDLKHEFESDGIHLSSKNKLILAKYQVALFCILYY